MSKRVFAVVGVVLMTTALALASASAFSLWGSEQKPSEAQPAQIPPAAPVQPGASLTQAARNLLLLRLARPSRWKRRA